jgi:hypothetical protein
MVRIGDTGIDIEGILEAGWENGPRSRVAVTGESNGVLYVLVRGECCWRIRRSPDDPNP